MTLRTLLSRWISLSDLLRNPCPASLRPKSCLGTGSPSQPGMDTWPPEQLERTQPSRGRNAAPAPEGPHLGSFQGKQDKGLCHVSEECKALGEIGIYCFLLYLFPRSRHFFLSLHCVRCSAGGLARWPMCNYLKLDPVEQTTFFKCKVRSLNPFGENSSLSPSLSPMNNSV